MTLSSAHQATTCLFACVFYFFTVALIVALPTAQHIPHLPFRVVCVQQIVQWITNTALFSFIVLFI